VLAQNAQEATAAAAAAAVVREATASAVMDVLEGESEEERASKLASAKEERMRKVIRCDSRLRQESGWSLTLEFRAVVLDRLSRSCATALLVPAMDCHLATLVSSSPYT